VIAVSVFILGLAASAAGYLWVRADGTDDRVRAAEIAAASLTAEVRVELGAIKASQARSEGLLASLSHGP
jgi:hypothetical protein